MTSASRTEAVGFLTDAGETASEAVRHQIARMEPLCQRTFTPTGAVLAASAGCYHYTPEGRKLADFTSGVLVANLGHNPTRWWRRVLEYMKLDPASFGAEFTRAVTLTSYNAITEVEAEATRRLIDNLRAQPGGGRLEQILWAASGSEAVQKALKAAFRHRQGSDIILATRHGFHGKKGLATAITGCERDEDRDPRVRFVSFPQEECFSVERRREPIDLRPYELELTALAEEFGDRIACLITEPYLGGGGSYHPQVEYLQLLERFCRDRDILFILDEVQSNFGRTGLMYAYTTYCVEPDMVVLGKGMANGLPVDAVAGSAAVFSDMSHGEGSDTWSAHPLGCAGVLATLDEFETSGILDQAAKLSKVLQTGLTRLSKLPAVEAVRGEGTVWGIHCAAHDGHSARDVALEIVKRCYEGDEQGRGIHLLGPLAGCVIRIAPPLVMPQDEASEYLELLFEIVSKLQQPMVCSPPMQTVSAERSIEQRPYLNRDRY